MGLIQLPQRHLTQPQYAAELDPLHWAFKDIVFAYSAGRGFTDGKHPKLAGTLTTFTTTKAGAKGKYLENTVPGNNAFFANHTDHDTLGGVTLIGLVQPSSVSGQMTVVSKDAGGGGTNTPLGLLLDSGAVSLNRANAGFRVWKGVATLAANQLAVVAVTQGANIGTAPKFYIDGQFDTGAAVNLFGGSGTGAPIATSEGIKVSANTTFNNRFLGGIYGALVLNRECSAEEVAELSKNLWAIWKAPARRIFAVPGAASYTITANSGSVDVTGTSANLKFGRLVSASSGSVAITGAAATLKHGSLVSASSGSFAVTGSAASLLLGRLLSAGSGSFAITGTDATLTKATGGQFTLAADSGSFVVTGNAAALVSTRLLSASSGSVIVTGTAAGLSASRALLASSGSVAVTGTDAALTYAAHNYYTLIASGGSVDVVGTDARLIRSGGESFSGGYPYISRESHAERKKKQRIALGIIEEETDGLEQFEISELTEEKPVLPATKKQHIPARQQKKLDQEAINAELKALIQLELDREEETIIKMLMEM